MTTNKVLAGKMFRDYDHLLQAIENDPVHIESITQDIIRKWDEICEEILLGYSQKDQNNVVLGWTDYSDYLINHSIPYYEKMEYYEMCAVLRDIAKAHKGRYDTIMEMDTDSLS